MARKSCGACLAARLQWLLEWGCSRVRPESRVSTGESRWASVAWYRAWRTASRRASPAGATLCLPSWGVCGAQSDDGQVAASPVDRASWPIDEYRETTVDRRRRMASVHGRPSRCGPYRHATETLALRSAGLWRTNQLRYARGGMQLAQVMGDSRNHMYPLPNAAATHYARYQYPPRRLETCKVSSCAWTAARRLVR